MASEKYQANYKKAADWIEENAPDYVKDCIDEMTTHIYELQNHIEVRDKVLRDICEQSGVDPDSIFKSN